MEWEAPGIVLAVRPFGEGDAVASVFTAAQGRHPGLARGAARRQAATWQPGNLVHVHWAGRLADQLGGFKAELVHPAAALAMDDELTLTMLAAACAVADGALPEREPHPAAFAALLRLVARLSDPILALVDLVRWEAALLSDLGYGLDVAHCAVTGATTDLAFVSPRTGRAVARSAAGAWRERLLALPPFMVEDVEATPADLRDGLRLTGHFLARDAFGAHHRPLPSARLALYDRVVAMTFHDSADSTEDQPDA